MMSSVNSQIQKAISDAISSQILHQIQAALNAGCGQMTQNRWNVPSERPEMNPEETYGEKTIEVSSVLTIKTLVILTYALTTAPFEFFLPLRLFFEYFLVAKWSPVSKFPFFVFFSETVLKKCLGFLRVSTRGPLSFFSVFCNKLDFQKAERAPFTILKILRFSSHRYRAPALDVPVLLTKCNNQQSRPDV